MGLKSNENAFIRDRKDTQRKSPVKTEVLIGVMRPKVKGCLEPPESRRDKDGFSPRTSSDSMAFDILVLESWPLEL